ncbi:LysR substrate-binding domain-containing protein [Celerinatantimonas sp. MCCC 1A17872]|uniref:LysR family transcriptional regulator n=1 Tax=Celerinatantimonas sp. MCCC 1A17872 TaxID=3177514 RepID=UPI0038BEC376
MKNIEAFTLAVDKGSFSQAADVLGVTPTMFSRYIRELEYSLGYKLINRTTRKQGLTRAGECYYAYCLKLIATAKEAKEALHHLDDEITGSIRISAPVVFGNRILAPLVAQFLLQYPGVYIDMDLSDRRVDLIEENYQIAIRIGNVLDDGVVAIALPSYQMVLAASPSYLNQHGIPTHPDDLTAHNCICFSQWHASRFWKMSNNSKEYSVDIRPRLVSNSGETIRQAALNGLGIALNSTLTLKDDIKAGRLIRVLADFKVASRPMHLLRLPGSHVSPAIDLFIQMLKTSLAPKVAV